MRPAEFPSGLLIARADGRIWELRSVDGYAENYTTRLNVRRRKTPNSPFVYDHFFLHRDSKFILVEGNLVFTPREYASPLDVAVFP